MSDLFKPVVLVVDDDPGTRVIARRALGKFGWHVREAEHGREALQIVAETPPNVILLDVEMPGLDGFETCREVRKAPWGATIPIMMMTGLDDIESINRAYEIGANDFISKPINWTILGHRIRYMLRGNELFNQLRRSESRLANAQRISMLGTWEWQPSGQKFYCSGHVLEILGLPDNMPLSFDELTGHVHKDDREAFARAVHITLSQQMPFRLEHRVCRPDGTERYVFHQGDIVWNDMERTLWLTGALQDITERKEAEAKIHSLAYYDPLTGLPNRAFFKSALRRTLALMERQTGLAAVLFIDLDDFKRINDTLGHEAGDQLLKCTADRLVQSVRVTDVVAVGERGHAEGVVARLGGDEFTVLLTDIAVPENAAKVAERILAALELPVSINSHEIYVTPSIGIAVYPHNGHEESSLLRSADAAMYHAKARGKNAYEFFTEAMNEKAQYRLALENGLRKALAANEFSVCYQPVMDLRTREVVAAEALLRWNSRELGRVPPRVFIEIAEASGLTLAIGEWLLQQVCAQISVWEATGLDPVRVSINLSAKQFARPNLIASLASALEHHSIPPHLLGLELTESMLAERPEESLEVLAQLKALGLHLALDDFGTGYSSLGFLKRSSIDALKIDSSYVASIPEDRHDAAIAETVIAMARRLSMRVVAEGVETEIQRAFLERNGCDQAQGFLFGGPLPAADFQQWLKRATTRRNCDIDS